MRGHNVIGEITVLSQTVITAMHVKYPITWHNPDFTFPHSVFCRFYGLFVWTLAKFP